MTTTIAIKCKDGVILATDTRATIGTFIAHKRVRKILPIDDHVAMTIAGALADAQAIFDILRANAKLYRLTVGRPIPIKSTTTLAANILFAMRRYPYLLQAVIGGVDYVEGPKVFVLDPFGSITEEKCISTGSGSPIAMGVLEDGYRENMSIEEGIPLVIRSITSAMKRDAGSGDNFDVAIVTKKGFSQLTEEEINKYLKTCEKART